MQKRFKHSWMAAAGKQTLGVLLLCSPSWAQPATGNALIVTQPSPVSAKRGSTAAVKLPLQIKPGFHINSNKPNDDYLIPLKVTWTAGALEVVETNFPKPGQESYPFSTKPLSVYSGDLEVSTTFKIPAAAPVGAAALTGKLRYQACNDKMCLPPKTLDLQATINVQ